MAITSADVLHALIRECTEKAAEAEAAGDNAKASVFHRLIGKFTAQLDSLGGPRKTLPVTRERPWWLRRRSNDFDMSRNYQRM
ncbi:hypothetical protein Msil_3077 [Methylocella silvestris BL2]|uniref:Uncharacterized protein n=1 Tax=Methylocella silvestris (strain DSM 15510 / CIP 108128 / LMG 27833 / NCIMB 13906 / BL2) TaxID=395965 RepID=B8EKV8_METSB|nr:hypothetical protein [Methylocella silvestris]ACK51986.1 hypothetical protein Msil_3077 [Methylocella silvestris BL2]